MGRRRQAREYALKMLFQIEVGKLQTEEVIKYFWSENQAPAEVSEYAEQLTRGVMHEKKLLDDLLAKQLEHWDLSRLAGVDRTILRIGAFELLRCPETPLNVIMNEAIELAKKYSTPESGSFVNGILDKLAKHRKPAT